MGNTLATVPYSVQMPPALNPLYLSVMCWRRDSCRWKEISKVWLIPPAFIYVADINIMSLISVWNDEASTLTPKLNTFLKPEDYIYMISTFYSSSESSVWRCINCQWMLWSAACRCVWPAVDHHYRCVSLTGPGVLLGILSECEYICSALIFCWWPECKMALMMKASLPLFLIHLLSKQTIYNLFDQTL